MPEDQRSQFTLRDMLALTTASAVGLSLLLVAMESGCDSGGSGRNTQCKNNIRQLAIALDGFQSHSGPYPGRLQHLGGQSVPWPVALLPQFERLDLYKDWTDPKLTSKPTPYLELLTCPQNLQSSDGPRLSYVANAGIADLNSRNLANGAFFDLTSMDSSEYMTADHVVDGKSNTLVFSENLQATTWDSVQPYDTIFVWHATTQPSQDMLINGGDVKSPVTATTARPSSKHGGGVNVAFADTRVIFLKETVDYRVYAQLMTPHDAQSEMPAAWKVPLDQSEFK